MNSHTLSPILIAAILCAQCGPPAPSTDDLESAIRKLDVESFLAESVNLDAETRSGLELVTLLKDLEERTWPGRVDVRRDEAGLERAIFSIAYEKGARLSTRMVASGELDDLQEVTVVSICSPSGDEESSFTLSVDEASPGSAIFRDVIAVTGPVDLPIRRGEEWTAFLTALRFPFTGGTLRIVPDEASSLWHLTARSKKIYAEFRRDSGRWILSRLREEE